MRKVNNLFRSYITDRSQYVTINDTNSLIGSVNYGIPQGSNLVPLSFSIYVNNIFNNFVSPPVLYADDTCLNIQSQNFEELEKLMNEEVETARQWMIAN